LAGGLWASVGPVVERVRGPARSGSQQDVRVRVGTHHLRADGVQTVELARVLLSAPSRLGRAVAIAWWGGGPSLGRRLWLSVSRERVGRAAVEVVGP